MKLTLNRLNFLPNCTIGRLFIGEEFICFTLEDKVREEKILGETAVPRGTYKVIVDYSEHFKKELPHLLDVPNFEGVRIHPGNTDKDTEGCILVGMEWNGGSYIGKSKEAFENLFKKIKEATDPIELDIS